MPTLWSRLWGERETRQPTRGPGSHTAHLLRLEERIVLDAAGIAEIDDGPDGDGVTAILAAPAVPEASAPSAGSDATPGAAHASNPGAPAGAEPNATESLPPAAGAEPVRVLLIAEGTGQAEALDDAAQDGVLTLVYDDQSTTAEHLLAQIQDLLGDRQADSIALASHGLEGDGFALVDGASVTLESLDNPEMASFWQSLGGMVESDGRIDILACDAAEGEAGAALIERLESLTGMDFAASVDETGNADHGGDWVLETDGVDAAATYFDAEGLAAVTGTLPNTAPTAADETVTVLEDGTYTFTAGDFNFSDADGGDTLQSVRITSLESDGDLRLSGGAVGLNQVISIADINAGNLTFEPDADDNGAGYTSFDFEVNDGTEFSAASYTMTLDVTAVNDAPSYTPGGNQTVNEDSGAHTVNNWATGMDPGPGDESGQSVSFQTQVLSGGGLFSSGPSVNAGGDLSYTLAANAYGTATVRVRAVDDGGTANGGDNTGAWQTFTITANGVNDAPTVNLPGAQSTTANATMGFSSDAGNAITVGDIDDEGNNMRVTLSVDAGTLTLGQTTGLSFSTGDGAADATMTFEGTETEINNALDGLQYNAGAAGSRTLTINVNDLGNSGAGGNLSSGNQNLTITVGNNNRPVLTGSGPLTASAIDEDGAATPFTVQDLYDSVGGSVTDANGDTVGIALIDMDNSDGTWQVNTGGGWFTPTVNAQRALLMDNTAQLRFLADTHVNTDDDPTPTVTFYAWDQTQGTEGAYWNVQDWASDPSSAFSAATDTGEQPINAVNDAPVNSIDGNTDFSAETQGTPENTALVFSTANGNAITLSDVDDNGLDMQVILTATNGTVSLNATGGELAALTSVVGDGTATVTITGSQAEIEAALDGMQFDPTTDYTGSTTLQVQTSDLGNSGAGGVLTDTDTVTIEVNRAPVLDNSGTLSLSTIAEDIADGANTGDTVASIVGATITDVDGDPEGVAITDLDNTNGTWQFNTGGGWTNIDATEVITNGNALLLRSTDSLRFVPDTHFNGAVTGGLTLRAWDQSKETVGTYYNITATGGTTAFSTATETVDITVTAVNDVPVVAGVDNTFTWTEGDGATVIDSNLTLTDPDDVIHSATVTITANKMLDDRLAASTGGTGITASYNETTGVLSLTGIDTVAHYQQVLRSVTFDNVDTGAGAGRYRGDNPSGFASAPMTSRTFAFRVNDGVVDSNIDDTSITVAGVNDAPILGNLEAADLAYTENDGAVAITTLATIADNDSETLDGLTVQVSGNYVNGEDVLAFSDQLGITGAWDAATGTLSLSGTTTLANYQTALRAITYQNTSDDPSTATRTLTVTLDDGSDTVADTRDVTVAAVNDAPDGTGIEPAALSYTEGDGAVAITSTLVVGDPDDTQLTGAVVRITGNYQNGQDLLAFTNQAGITGVWDAATGTMTLSGNASLADYQTALRSVTYENTSNVPSTATRTVTFTLDDGADTSAVTRDIDVIGTNDAPPALALSANVVSEGAANGTAIGAVSGVDPEGDTVSYAILSGNADGAFAIDANTGALTVANGAALDFEAGATRNLIVRATDDGIPSAHVDQAFTINLTNVNEAPAALTLSNATIQEDAPVGTGVGSVLGADPEGDPLTYSIVGGDGGGIFAVDPATGVVRLIQDNALNAGAQGSYTLVIRAEDNGAPAAFVEQAVTIQVTPAPPPPDPDPDPDPVDSGDDGGDPVDPVDPGDPGDVDAGDDGGAGGGDPLDDGGDSGGDPFDGGDFGDIGDIGDTGPGAADPGDTPGDEGSASEGPANEATDAGDGGAAIRDETELPREGEAVREEEMREAAPESVLIDPVRAVGDPTLFDDSQPAELRAIVDSLLTSYVHAGEGSSVYLQSAFQAVVEAAAGYRRAEALILDARQDLEVLEPRIIQEEPALRPYVADVEAAQREVRAASEAMRAALAHATQGGEAFDRAAQDVILAAMESLDGANEELATASGALQAAVGAARGLSEGETLPGAEVESVAEAAREEARRQLRESRASQDQARKDLFAAFLQQLADARAGEDAADPETTGPDPSEQPVAPAEPVAPSAPGATEASQ